MLSERETTGSNRLIFHHAQVRYVPRDACVWEQQYNFRFPCFRRLAVIKSKITVLEAPEVEFRTNYAQHRRIMERYSKLGRRGICHLERHCYDHRTTGSPKRSRYVGERTRKRQNKFTYSFYQFTFNLLVSGAGRRLTQRNKRLFAVVSFSEAQEKPTARWVRSSRANTSKLIKVTVYLEIGNFLHIWRRNGDFTFWPEVKNTLLIDILALFSRINCFTWKGHFKELKLKGKLFV